MIGRWEALLHRWRHRLSRNAWLVWLLGTPALPASPQPDDSPQPGGSSRPGGRVPRRGLLLIQIDGLARRHFEAALAKGRMPFCQRLLDREHYQLHTMYSGIPSTTPSVQGELFYGVRQVVPAFSFRDSRSGQQVRMFEATIARCKQTQLEAQTDQPLLQGGSAYCNIYTGGAAEPHYCAASLGWGELTDGVRPWTWLLIAVLYTPEILRACLLAVLELIVALRDGVLGFISRHHLLQELEFVVRRVSVCVVMRELATIAASLDAARGLPVVEVNFLGYDEQSHHRGPDAHYAHWSLGGIDNAIERIWRAAARSPHREFDLWIYSDHGQERTTSYVDRYGLTIQTAVGEVINAPARNPLPGHRHSGKALRASYLRRAKAVEAFDGGPPAAEAEVGEQDTEAEIDVIALGPLGFVYYQRDLSHQRWEEIAAALVQEAHVPLVLLAEADGRAQAWAAGRHGYLPEDAALFLGEDHPFLEQASEDLVRLAHHGDAGNLVIAGWAAGEQALTFVLERGAHAGCAPDEVTAFALLPPDAPLEKGDGLIERPLVLRDAILRRDQKPAPRRARAVDPAARSVRVMTYNIHSCIGMDGRTSPERVARVIAASGADVIALQEVDVGRQRTSYLHQAQRLAELLEMHTHFHSTFSVAEEEYGHAVLSRWPLRIVRGEPLPTLLPKSLEPRGALWVELEIDGHAVQLINTHLGLVTGERLQQIELLLGPLWLGSIDARQPVIFCGDLNAGPRSPVCRKLTAQMVDVQTVRRNGRPEKTFFSRWPLRRIDHIFVRGPWDVQDVRVLRSTLARRASDHLPLIADLRLPSRS